MTQFIKTLSLSELNFSEVELVNQIRSTFNLTEAPFDNIDDALLLLAFIPQCKFPNKYVVPGTPQRLKAAYQTCDNQSLEFYGDRILYAVVASYVYEVFGLDNSKDFLTQLVSSLTNNRFLTDLMLNKNACGFIRSVSYEIRDQKEFNKLCANAFEALIGAFFIHFQSQRLDIISTIKNWLLKNTDLPMFLASYLISIGSHLEGVYKINDRKALFEENLKDWEEKLSTSPLPDLYFRANPRPELSDFPNKSIIVTERTPVDQIFNQLGWKYALQYDNEMGTFIIYGGSRGDMEIGAGASKEIATMLAKDFLLSRGYITFLEEPDRYFTH